VTVSEPRERVILVAEAVEHQIEQLDVKQAAAVNDAIDCIGITRGRPIDLPNSDPAYPYFALPVRRSAQAPVVIYRHARPDEDADFIVLSLMSPEQYRQQIADERSGMLRDPVIREEIRVAAGTAAAVAVQAIPGTVAGGAAPTTSGDPVPGD